MLRKVYNLCADNYLLVLILLTAAFLRYWGITHGFPFIYNVDEPELIRTAYGLRFDINPGHFSWPHLYYYFNGIFYVFIYYFRGLLNITGARETVESVFPLLWQDPVIFYWTSRMLTAFFGVITAIIVYITAKRFIPANFALLAALFFALMPYHVEESKKALLEAPLIFLMFIVVYFSLKIADTGKLKYYLLAGLFVGLSTSVKYNGAFIAINVILAHFIYWWSVKGVGASSMFEHIKRFPKTLFSKNLIYAGIVSLVVFALTTPFAVLDYKTFIRTDSHVGALWQFSNVGKVSNQEALSQFAFNVTERFPESMTYGIWLSAILGLLILIYKTRPDRRFLLLTMFPVLYVMYASTAQRQPTHYYLPMFTFAAVWSAYFFYTVFERLKTSGYYVSVFLFILTVIVGAAFIQSAEVSRTFAAKDSRNYASEWIDAKVESGEKLLIDGRRKPHIINSKVKVRDLKTDMGYRAIQINDYPEYVIWSKYEGDPYTDEHWGTVTEQLNLRVFFSGKGNLGPDIYIFDTIGIEKE